MNNLVSNKNMKSLLLGIKTKILTDINSKDITEDQKLILNKVNNMISNGNGLKILTDNGSYKDCNAEELKTAINNTDNVFDLFNISVLEEKWENVATFPYILMNANSLILDSSIYTLGGLAGTSSSAMSKKMVKTSLSDYTHEYMSECPVTISCEGLYHNNKSIYSIGGWINSSPFNYTTFIYKYDMTTNTWSNPGQLPSRTTHNYYTATSGYNNYIFTGFDKLYKYDITTNTIETLYTKYSDNIKSLCVCENKLYIYYTSHSTTYDIDTGIEIDNLHYTKIVDYQKYYPAISTGNIIYMMMDRNYECNKLLIYNIVEDSAIVQNIPFVIYECSFVCNTDNIYAVGGALDKNVTNKIYKYTKSLQKYDLILPNNIQDKLDIIKKDGTGTKILSDNGEYIVIPKGYRYMNENEINELISAVTTE